jgi:hypothetical protein
MAQKTDVPIQAMAEKRISNWEKKNFGRLPCKLLIMVLVLPDSEFQGPLYHDWQWLRHLAAACPMLWGAGTGFRGIVVLLIWISEFGHTCYGSA